VGDNETCKVADFGLLREIPKDDSIYQMHTNVPCPVRWMPPESISQRKFSTASDVWSFGVLQWEMFNPKKTPYGSFGNMEVAMKVSSVHVHRMCVLSWNLGVYMYMYVWALICIVHPYLYIEPTDFMILGV
jgi:serine/threonine protein kinase